MTIVVSDRYQIDHRMSILLNIYNVGREIITENVLWLL